MCTPAPSGQTTDVATSEEAKRAENEAVFRDVNERIETAALELDPPLERVPFLCECDDVACREIIPLTPAEYEHVRVDGAVFVVASGHTGDSEILEERGTYAVIRKTEGEATVARALDPRDES
jgi:hypothetical protein